MALDLHSNGSKLEHGSDTQAEALFAGSLLGFVLQVATLSVPAGFREVDDSTAWNAVNVAACIINPWSDLVTSQFDVSVVFRVS